MALGCFTDDARSEDLVKQSNMASSQRCCVLSIAVSKAHIRCIFTCPDQQQPSTHCGGSPNAACSAMAGHARAKRSSPPSSRGTSRIAECLNPPRLQTGYTAVGQQCTSCSVQDPRLINRPPQLSHRVSDPVTVAATDCCTSRRRAVSSNKNPVSTARAMSIYMMPNPWGPHFARHVT